MSSASLTSDHQQFEKEQEHLHPRPPARASVHRIYYTRLVHRIIVPLSPPPPHPIAAPGGGGGRTRLMRLDGAGLPACDIFNDHPPGKESVASSWLPPIQWSRTVPLRALPPLHGCNGHQCKVEGCDAGSSSPWVVSFCRHGIVSIDTANVAEWLDRRLK